MSKAPEYKIMEGFKGERAIVTPYSVRNFQAKNIFTQDAYVTHIGYYPYALHHYRERDEGAPEHILIFCDEGKGYIKLGGENYTLTKNNLFVIPAHTRHSYQADAAQPWSIFWIHFMGCRLERYAPIIGRQIEEPHRLPDREALFEEIYQTLAMGYSPDNLEYSSSTLRYLLASFQYPSQYAKAKDQSKTDTVERSILYMKDNLGARLTLDQVARQAGYSPSHFGALFMAKTSFSPMDYYHQLKIQKACSLLQFSNLSIKEVASSLGYYDAFHFSKAFKHEMEISPREYRQRYQATGR